MNLSSWLCAPACYFAHSHDEPSHTHGQTTNGCADQAQIEHSRNTKDTYGAGCLRCGLLVHDHELVAMAMGMEQRIDVNEQKHLEIIASDQGSQVPEDASVG